MREYGVRGARDSRKRERGKRARSISVAINLNTSARSKRSDNFFRETDIGARGKVRALANDCTRCFAHTSSRFILRKRFRTRNAVE